MPQVIPYSNSGVENIIGIEFQKHCAIYILLKDRERIFSKEFYLYFEHYDDFLFCYKNNIGEIEGIESFQAKKSSDTWKISELHEILSKILVLSENIKRDVKGKSKAYIQKLNFITNNSIKIDVKKIKIKINEANESQQIGTMDDVIKNEFRTNILSKFPKTNTAELDNIYLMYIDLPKNVNAQKNTLVGLINEIFGDKIHDHKAALGTLLELFKGVESEYNQGGVVDLENPKKKVDKKVIEEGIKVITNKSKAFELWRSKRSNLTKVLSIPISEQLKFESIFTDSFDSFKDLEQAEHQKILDFVKTNIWMNDIATDEIEVIGNMYKKFITEEFSQLGELDTKSIIFAAYIQLTFN